jgi:hypothetical protein
VSPPDEKPTRRRRSAPVGASVLDLRAGRTPRARSRDDAETRRGAVGRNHEPVQGAGLEAARTSKARTPGEHSHPGASSGGTLAEILRHSGDRTPGSHLVRSRADDQRRRLGGGRGFARASKVMGVEAAAEGQHGPGRNGSGVRRRVVWDASVVPARRHLTSRVFQQRSARGASHEKCLEARGSTRSHDAPRGARCQREEGRLRPWRVVEGPRFGGSKALEGRGRPGEHRPPRTGQPKG